MALNRKLKMARPTLYMMLGYPGAGKTTTAKIIHELTGAEHLSSDQIRLELFPNPQFTPEEHKTLYEAIDFKTKQLLSECKSVIYDANLNRYIHRQQKYDICKQTNTKPVLVWVRTDKDVAKQRATQDGDNDKGRPYGNLDEPTFERLVRKIEPPRGDEPVIILDGIKITNDYVKQALLL